MDGFFCLLNLARLYQVLRLKPLPCHRRATAKPNSFEFGTAVARRLEQALFARVGDHISEQVAQTGALIDSSSLSCKYHPSWNLLILRS